MIKQVTTNGVALQIIKNACFEGTAKRNNLLGIFQSFLSLEIPIEIPLVIT